MVLEVQLSFFVIVGCKILLLITKIGERKKRRELNAFT